MTTLTIGKFRSLQQCTSPRGTFTCLALDHRQNLRKANPAYKDDAQLSCFKLDVTAELAPYATSVLLDPEVSAAQAIAGLRPWEHSFDKLRPPARGRPSMLRRLRRLLSDPTDPSNVARDIR